MFNEEKIAHIDAQGVVRRVVVTDKEVGLVGAALTGCTLIGPIPDEVHEGWVYKNGDWLSPQ